MIIFNKKNGIKTKNMKEINIINLLVAYKL